MFIHLDKTPERDGQTDSQSDLRSALRAMRTSCKNHHEKIWALPAPVCQRAGILQEADDDWISRLILIIVKNVAVYNAF